MSGIWGDLGRSEGGSLVLAVAVKCEEDDLDRGGDRPMTEKEELATSYRENGPTSQRVMW
jgi:hypothetical protein